MYKKVSKENISIIYLDVKPEQSTEFEYQTSRCLQYTSMQVSRVAKDMNSILPHCFLTEGQVNLMFLPW